MESNNKNKLKPQVIPTSRFGPKDPPEGLILRRVIGGLDIDGKGTNHPLKEVDPWFLVDEAMVKKGTKLPFGKHPHTGLCANTVLLDSHSYLWDNHQNK